MPAWARIAVIAWLAIYVPVYAAAYGALHFLQLCDLGVLLACLGVLLGNRLLLSAQAIGAPGIALLWLADLGWTAISGHGLHGGTAYLWDASVPALARVLSLFHLVLPIALVLYLRRSGYDPRALPLQSAIAAAAIALSWWFGSAQNLNYVTHWPNGAAVLPAIAGVHAFVCWLSLCAVIYLPTHLFLLSFLPAKRQAR